MTLRNYGVHLLANLLFTCVLSYAIIRYRDSVSSLIIGRDLSSIIPLLIVIYLKMILAPIDSIDKEWGCSWLLRSSNVSRDLLVNAKVLFGYIISIPFVLPTLGWVSILDRSTWVPQLGIVLNLLFLFPAMKFFASTLFSNGSDQSIDLFLSNFLQIVTMFFFWGAFTMVKDFSVSVMFLYSTIIASLFVTKYGTPIKYYLVELISNIYFFTLLLAGFIGALMVVTALLRAPLFMDTWGSSILTLWFFTASLSTSFLVRDYLMKWTARLFLE